MTNTFSIITLNKWRLHSQIWTVAPSRLPLPHKRKLGLFDLKAAPWVLPVTSSQRPS